MNHSSISPDDPRLTAYALGEMEPEERVRFEELLQQDAAAQAAVEDIRATAQALDATLQAEPLPVPASAPDLVRAAIVQGRDPRKLDGGPLPGRGKLLRFPSLYFSISGLAAACFAMFFAYWLQTRPDHELKRYVEVDLDKVQSGKKEVGVAANLPAAAPADSVPEAADAVGATASANKDDEGRVSGVVAAQKTAAPAQVATAQLQAEARTVSAPLRPDNFAGAGRDWNGIGAMAKAGGAARPFNTETYAALDENPFLTVAQNPLSTFSVDVDTASYANVRRFLAQGQLPPRDAVRIEELVNYFPYHYPPPPTEARAEAAMPPFAASLETAAAPWAPDHRLVRIGLKGREVSEAARPTANLVFLLDVSGSMDEPNKLPLVKQSMKLLLGKLRPDDRVAIVVYAGGSGLALPSTSVREQAKIAAAIDELTPGGSTNGALGIQLAYDIAKANFVAGGVNRVILATDGDFNVGVTGEGELTRLIEEKAQSGVFLTVLGFGMGNYKDATLQKLADKGRGNYAYIDNAAEARKALVEQAGGTLVTIAKDVKIQVEFNPARVQAYRLIGYEKRLLRNEDFNNDKVDAGEIGAGHTVTALYEVVPLGAPAPDTGGSVDPLKYNTTDLHRTATRTDSDELLTLKVRYKEPAGDESRKLEFPLRDEGRAFADASADFKFAAAVASFGMILRDSPHKGHATLADVTNWARAGLEEDAGGYRAEFLGLVKTAQALLPN